MALRAMKTFCAEVANTDCSIKSKCVLGDYPTNSLTYGLKAVATFTSKANVGTNDLKPE